MSEMSDKDKANNNDPSRLDVGGRKTLLNESWGAQKPTPPKESKKKGR